MDFGINNPHSAIGQTLSLAAPPKTLCTYFTTSWSNHPRERRFGGLNANLDCKTLMRLAAISITPVLVVNLLFEFVPVRIPGWFLLGIVIELGYLFFAVKVNLESDVPQYQLPPAYPTVMS